MLKTAAQSLACTASALAVLGTVLTPVMVPSLAHATPISELPLKPSVLAKPNVIFAMDDSGSMDAEVMLDGTFQGFFYGNYGSTTLYPSGGLRTGGAQYDWNMLYLFPNGTGSGNRVVGDPHASYGYAIPPTPQLAFLRSPAFNTLYYDTTKTYLPWAPAVVSGTAVTNFSNANASAARSHPSLGSTTMAINANINSNTTNWRFTFTAGMTIPAGAANVSCLWNGGPGPLPWTVTTDRGLCTAQLSYYPATFWHRENCTVNGTDCVAAYNGQTIKRYEIRSGNTFPSGRSFAAEMQNFSNWFSYYRKRRLLLAGAMGEVLENITGLRMGVVNFNAHAVPTMFDADATAPAQNRLAVAGRFYNNEGNGGTPTHATMSYIHNQFDTNTNIIQFACQRNAQFIITDGFANDGATAPPAYNRATFGSGAPYEAIATNSLHDKALGAFTYRLRATTSPLAAGRVPLGPQTVQNPDPNPDLHLNTYALTLGMKGTLWPTAANPFVSPPTWPTPVINSASMIDDLWHATLNGRGQMYLATTPEETAAGIQAGLADIISQVSAQSGVAVATMNLVRGDSRAYFGTYNPSGWKGDVTARSISPDTAIIGTSTVWSASDLLTARNWTTRVIASATAGGGVPFTAANVGTLVNPGGIYGDSTALINYLRGSRADEGDLWRARTGLMGAIMNSEPWVSAEDGVLYVASGEGMLHAFDIVGAGAGQELWAFVPRAVLPDIGQTSQRGYAFKTQLDGSPVVARIGTTQKLLVAGMGAAGRSYYALDVTTPRGLSESSLASKVLWEFPAAGDSTMAAKVGQTLGRPVVVKSPSHGWVVLLTSGYNNDDGVGRLWVLNATTGALIKEFSTGAGGSGVDAGLAHVAGFEEGDGSTRYVYGGDLLGNVWRFDLQTLGTPTVVATLRGPTGAVQAVTTQPELAMIGTQRVLVLITGRLLHPNDFGNNAVNTLYVLSDGATLTNARNSLVAKTYTRGNPDSLTGATVNWATQRGWFMDLPAGEQGNTRPALTYGGISFVTNVNGATDCSASSFLYLVDMKSGERYPEAGYIGWPISSTENSSRPTPMITRSQQLRANTQTSGGNSPPPPLVNPRPVGAGKTAWREVRR
jgi:type IV pilus assembly protein PilY1